MDQQESPRPDPTLALLERWRTGDRSALDALMSETLPWLRAEVRNVLGGEGVGVHDSADLVQTTVLNFLSWGPRFLPRSGAQLRILLRRIASNVVVDQRRRLKLGGPHLESVAAGASSPSAFGPAESSSAGPSRIAEREEDASWVRLALQFLEPDERVLLVASEVEGRDWGAIARDLALPNADAARMRAARLKPRVANLIRRLRSGVVPVDE